MGSYRDTQSRLWFPLYKLVKVLRAGGGGASIVDVVSATHAGYTVTAVLCSNSGLVFRFTGDAAPLLGLKGERRLARTIVRASSYFSDRSLVVTSISLCPDGHALLVTLVNGALYVLPVTALLFPSSPGEDIGHPTVPSLLSFLKLPSSYVEVDERKRIAKVFTIELQRSKGRDKVNLGWVRGSVWWRAQSGRDYAVSACSGGFVVVTDIAARVEKLCFTLTVRPTTLQLSHDAQGGATYLLVSGRRGVGNSDMTEHACSVLLEHKESSAPAAAPWESIVSLADPSHTPHTPSPPAPLRAPYEPVLLSSLSATTSPTRIWTGPLGRGKDGVSVFQPAQQEVSCFDASLTPSGVRNPLYVYHVGPDATAVHVTSGAVVYCHVVGGHQKLTILSRHAATAHPRARSRTGPDCSVLQELQLSYERIHGFAHYGTAAAPSDGSLPVESVLVWTENSLYELRPSHTPLQLFTATLYHGIHSGGTEALRLLSHADSLAKAYQLDIMALYEDVADRCRGRNVKWALQLYKRIDVQPLRYLGRLARHSGQEDVLRHLASFMKMGYEGLHSVLFYTAIQSVLSFPRRNGVPVLPAWHGSAASLSRLSEISLESDDNASRSASSVKSFTARSYGALRDLDAQSRNGIAASTRASAHATAASANDIEASTAKTYEEDSCFDTAHHDLTENEPAPDALLALSSAVSATDPADAAEAIKTLCEVGMVERALGLAAKEKRVGETLALLRAQGCCKLPAACVTRLVEAGHAGTLRGFPDFVRCLSADLQLVILLATIADGDATQAWQVGPLLMACVKTATLHGAYERLKLYSIDLCVLALLRLAQLTDAQQRAARGGDDSDLDSADAMDTNTCDLLRQYSGEWSAEMVQRYATATGRLRVVSSAALIEREHETAVLYFMMWLKRRFNCASSDEDVATKVSELAADFMHDVLDDEPEPVARRRCLRMALAFYQTLRLQPHALVEVLRESNVEEDMLRILLSTPAVTEILPVSYRLDITRDYVTSYDPLATSTPSVQREAMVKTIPVHSDVLKASKRDGKEYIFFTCGHAPMSIAMFVKKMSEVQPAGCPVTAQALKSITQRISSGQCKVVPMGCPRCVFAQLPKTMTIPSAPSAQRPASGFSAGVKAQTRSGSGTSSNGTSSGVSASRKERRREGNKYSMHR